MLIIKRFSEDIVLAGSEIVEWQSIDCPSSRVHISMMWKSTECGIHYPQNATCQIGKMFQLRLGKKQHTFAHMVRCHTSPFRVRLLFHPPRDQIPETIICVGESLYILSTRCVMCRFTLKQNNLKFRYSALPAAIFVNDKSCVRMRLWLSHITREHVLN